MFLAPSGSTTRLELASAPLAGRAGYRLAVSQHKTAPGSVNVRVSDIDDLILLAECSFDGEWEGQVRFLPV